MYPGRCRNAHTMVRLKAAVSMTGAVLGSVETAAPAHSASESSFFSSM